MSEWVEKMLRDFYREEAIDKHAAQLAAAPRWQRIGHAIVAGWRCPACIAFKQRSKGIEPNK